ncbi:MAG TPA: outer membrane beta-barrel protein [Balneolales bacterium]|nr:outer membrane beta-barrel protein [Balneolales bacterium]
MSLQHFFRSVVLFLLLFTFQITPSHAQRIDEKWGIDLLGGIPFSNFNERTRSTAIFGMNLRYAVSPAFSLQLSGYKGTFKQSKRPNYYNRQFQNNFFRFSIRQQINLFPLLNLNSVANYFDIVGFTGIGFISNNVKTDISTSIPGYERWAGVNYKGNSLVYSIGGGLRFNITPHFSFIAQYEYNLTNSDYIDGYKTIEGINQNGKTRVTNDAFSLATAGFSINFGKRRRTSVVDKKSVTIEPAITEQKNEQLEKLGTLVQNNTKNLEETNNQIRQTIQILNNFVKFSSENQLEKQKEYSKKLQEQIDSLRSKQLKTDSLMALKQRSDSLVLQQQKVEEAPKSTAKYFLVADSYLEFDKANTMLTKLKSEGYVNATIVSDKTNTYYLVAYTVMDDKKAAQILLKKIKSYQNPMAWLYESK